MTKTNSRATWRVLIKRLIPRPYRKFLKRVILKPVRRLLFFGRNHYCPVCRSNLRKFLTDPHLSLPNFICPVCYAFGRHRLAWIFFQNKTNLLDSSSKRMLHISPEEGLEENFRRISSLTYVTADLNLAPMMVKMDITGIPFLDHSFDILYCSHVLEHIQNDRKAMDELNRVLKPGGHAIVQVPIADGKTFEDPSVTNPAERKQLFGQSDHVRRYGWDFKDRLEESGFSVRLLSASEIANENRLPMIGIPMDEVVFLARSKPFVKDHSDNLSLFQIRNG